MCIRDSHNVSRSKSRLDVTTSVIGSRQALRHMTLRELEEYRALRDTIRERGTARHWIVVVGFGLWAALTLAIVAFATLPVATLLPLLVLVVAVSYTHLRAHET